MDMAKSGPEGSKYSHLATQPSIECIWRVHPGLSGLNADVVVSGKTNFLLQNSGSQNRISASHNCRMMEFASTLILKTCPKENALLILEPHS